MIPASRGERIRAVKLAGAVLAVFVCAAWRVTEAMTEAPVLGPRKVVAIGGDRPAGRVAEATLPDREDGPQASIDPAPFRPLEVAAAPPARPAPGGIPFLRAPSPMPPTLVGSLAPNVAPLKVAPLGTLPEAAPSVRLTGVVVGARPTAVVMVGDEEIVVRPGSRLPDGSKVVRIDATSATLVHEGRTTVVEVAE